MTKKTTQRSARIVSGYSPRAPRRRFSGVLIACFAGLAAVAAPSATIRWEADARPPAVEVVGVAAVQLQAFAGLESGDAAWARVFAVYAEQGAVGKDLPPMVGTWNLAGDRLRFTPRFPLMRGVRYRAEFRPTEDVVPEVSYFELPADTTEPTTVVQQVYPSGEVLPENQLKFYVHFSAPMSRGGVYGHIRIRDGAGVPAELPFLELDEELWDPSMTRLTLLIDPGRIKRGVKPLEDIGPVFEVGRNYSLTVTVACQDATGRPLRSAFEKKFLVAAADRAPPDPKRWQITAPATGTRAALVVRFDEPMDHALALRLIQVTVGADAGFALEGESALGEGERRWSFAPAQPWRRGPHRLVVATTIEDLAGNNIGKAFDVDGFERVNRKITTESVAVMFEVKD